MAGAREIGEWAVERAGNVVRDPRRGLRRMPREMLRRVQEQERNPAARIAAGAAALGAGLATAWALSRFVRRGADLRGQVALVTGSSRGLGLAMARELAEQGCNLVICARDAEELQRAAAELSARGATVLAVSCDVGDREQVDRMVQQATDAFGGIDILVNNAGIITVGPLASQDVADFELAMRVMFWGVVYPTLAIVPQMLARGTGRIVNITSIGGKVSVPHLVPYNCAKFAAVGFSEGLHAELRRFGIRVTTVVPGLMRTGSHINAYFKGKNEAEYGWFSLSGTMPVVSMNANRAARTVVRALRRGDAEIFLTPQARAAAMIHGVAPGLTSKVLAAVNAMLPNAPADGGHERHLGRESETAVTRSPLTAFGKMAARDLNQVESGGAASALRHIPERAAS
jgi:short-subunit dehydrogenase